MLTALLAATILMAPQSVPAPPPSQDPVEAPVRLEDVVVDARRLDEAAEAYVDLVAAPPRGRSLARWREGVCVGVANLKPEAAQYLLDRVSDVARGLNLRAHEPECHPTVLIVATSNAPQFAEDFVARRPRLFRVGGAGMDRGSAALREFISSDRAVRWWHVSMTIDSELGDPVVRLPGQINGSGVELDRTVMDYAPVTLIDSPSRLNTQYVDVLKRVFIIVDMDRMNGATLQQLGDYVSMVAMAQVDPDADTSHFDTILNLFDDPATAPTGLTGWDRAYLDGLYNGSETRRINQRVQIQAVAAAIAGSYRGAALEEGEEP